MLIDVRLGLSIAQCAFFATTTTRPSQPPPHPDNDSIQSQHNQTRAQLQTSPASSSPSLWRAQLCAGLWLHRISPSTCLLSSSRKKEWKKEEQEQKISLSVSRLAARWFIYQDLRLHFDDHHHLFRFYFLCNFAHAYRQQRDSEQKAMEEKKTKVALKKIVVSIQLLSAVMFFRSAQVNINM